MPAFDMLEDAQAHLTILDALAANDSDRAANAVRQAMAQWQTRPPIYADKESEAS
jgi:DNA-binding GntR family transcriptional regulator